MKLILTFFVTGSLLVGCQYADEKTLLISNQGIRFHSEFDFPRVFINGNNELEILRQDHPPLAQLLSCLNEEDKWKAAYVLLTLRYEREYSSTMDEWNGLNYWAMPSNSEEMRKASAYWYNKYELGQLEEVLPPFNDELMNYYSYSEPKAHPNDSFESTNSPSIFGTTETNGN